MNGLASNIEVLEGEVHVMGAEKQRLVTAGFGTQIAKGGAPPPPRRLLPRPGFDQMPEVVRQVNWRLTWLSIEGAVNYRVEISADQELDVLLWDQLVTQPHVTLPEFDDGRYWIRVRGIDDNGLEGNSRMGSIILDTQPQPPVSLNPPDGAVQRGGSAELQWTASEDADRYLLEIATDEVFQQIVHKVTDLDVTHYQPSGISEPATYYWRITSISSR